MPQIWQRQACQQSAPLRKNEQEFFQVYFAAIFRVEVARIIFRRLEMLRPAALYVAECEHFCYGKICNAERALKCQMRIGTLSKFANPCLLRVLYMRGNKPICDCVATLLNFKQGECAH
jgi:hypothetical protein